MEAHRDVDEEAASTRGEHRYPTHSVIVYLDVEKDVPGPTCVWVPLDGDIKERRQSSALLCCASCSRAIARVFWRATACRSLSATTMVRP